MYSTNSQHIRLESLLNDESFIRWLKDKADPQEKLKWESWLNENPDHRELVKKAKKFLDMPFTEAEVPDLKKELARFHNLISDMESSEGKD